MLVMLLFLATNVLSACGAPVRIGIREASAATVATQSRSGPKHGDLAEAGQPSAPGADAGAAIIGPINLLKPRGPNEIVGVRLEGVTPIQDGVQEVTFGQIFGLGQVPADAKLAASMDGRMLPVQLDAKTHYSDGSVCMGVVTVAAPHSGDMLLVRQSQTSTEPIVDLTRLPASGYKLTVDLLLHEISGDRPLHFDAMALLANALRSKAVSYWLRGPQVTEARVDVPVDSSLHLTFDVRAYVDGTIRTDVQVNNDIALQPVGGELRYDVSINQNEKVIFQRTGVDHFQYQTWHTEVWSRSASQVNVVHDVAAMAQAGAVQNYDLATGVDRHLVDEEQRLMAGPGFDILQDAHITRYMGMTGGRPDIGPTTMYNTIWLITQNVTAAKFALAQADAAGSIPWHFIDPATKTYITLSRHPKLWTDPRGGSNGVTGLTQQVDAKGTGWSLDLAHQPDLSYVPYLLTGTRYYLDQLDAQAAWTLLGTWPKPREDEKGIVVSNAAQVRSQAWDLRELVEAAYATPDNSTLKTYFRQMVANNFEHFLQAIRSSHEGEAYGWKPGVYVHGTIAPWQQDYLATSVVLAAEQGVPGAKEVLTWQTHFLAGRFLAGAKGLSPYDGALYMMYMARDNLDEPYQTWREIAAASAAHGWGGGTTWPRNTFHEYLRAARAVLSGIETVTGSAEAKAALDWLTANGPGLDAQTARRAPTWNIVPISHSFQP